MLLQATLDSNRSIVQQDEGKALGTAFELSQYGKTAIAILSRRSLRQAFGLGHHEISGNSNRFGDGMLYNGYSIAFSKVWRPRDLP